LTRENGKSFKKRLILKFYFYFLSLNDKFIYLLVYNIYKGENMSKRRTNDLEKHVAVSLPKQFVLEAQSLHMTPTTYWKYLKHLSGYVTVYDQILADNEVQQSKPTQDNADQSSTQSSTQQGSGNTEQ